MKSAIATYLILSLPFVLIGQSHKKELSDAYELYESGKYEESSKRLESALRQQPKSLEGKFNLGDSYFREERYEEAAGVFKESIDLATDDNQKSKAYHNLGNAQIQAGKIQESIASYKQALRLNPKDEDARYNLAYAKKKLKEQQEQNQKNKDQENKDQKDQEQQDQQDQQENKDDKGQKNEDQENKEQQGEDQKDQQEKQDKGEQDDKGKENEDQKPQAKPGEEKENEISKEDAQRILEALKNQEQETQDKLRKQKVKDKSIKIEKDW